MRLLRPTETRRGSEGQISHEAIKADRPLPTVVDQECKIHVKFGLLTPTQFLSTLIASCKNCPSETIPVSVGLNVQKASWP